MRTRVRLALAILAPAMIASCSPPTRHAIQLCYHNALAEGRGRSLTTSDIGELVEACMLDRGYALNEDNARCSDNLKTATNAACYYRNTFFGRMYNDIQNW